MAAGETNSDSLRWEINHFKQIDTHTGRAVYVLVVVKVALLVAAAEQLQIAPQLTSQQAVVVGEVHQRVIVHLVTGHPVSHGNALQDK